MAPVFLLSGVGIMLTVFTNRLARAVDRARELERERRQRPRAEHARETCTQPLATLAQARAPAGHRDHALHDLRAAGLGRDRGAVPRRVLQFRRQLTWSTALFIAAMLSFIGAILCFLREVFIATRTLRIGLRRACD